MKVEFEFENRPHSYPVYVTEDGARYRFRSDALRHEALLLKGSRKIEENGIMVPYDEVYMNLYNITCKEDWDYLWKVNWEQNTAGDEFTTPGWYGVIWHDGGDYSDSYEVINIANFLQKQENFLQELKDLTSA